MSAASDLETLDITGVKNAAATPVAPAIAFASATDLTNLTLKGAFASVSATGCGNLTNVTISAAVTAGVTLSTNTDLTTVTLTGSSMTGLTFAGNTDMENLTVDTTWTDGTLSVTDNTSLISLTCSSDNLENLTVTGNDDMTTVNFTGVTKGGSTGSPSVAIYDNDLNASAVDTIEDPAVTDFGATDGGSFTSASGMDTLKTYLTAISADADTTAHVFWDNMESFTDEASAESTDKLFILADGVNAQTNAAYITILRQLPNTAAAGSGATKAKKAWVIDGVSAGNLTRLVNNSTEIFAGGAGETYTANTGINMLALSGNQTLDLASIINTAHGTRATATEATLTASAGGNWSTTVTIETLSATLGASGTVTGERYTTSAARTAASSAVTIAGYNITNFMDSDDYVTLTVGSNSVTATGQGTGVLAQAVATAWQAKYGVAGTASSSSNATVTASDAGVITVRGYDHSGGAGTTVAMSVTASGTVGTGNAAEGVEYTIGATRSAADNDLTSTAIIVMLESNVAGTVLNKLVGAALTSSATVAELTTSALANSVGAGEKTAWRAAHEDAPDARNAEDAVAGGAATDVKKTRVAWL